MNKSESETLNITIPRVLMNAIRRLAPPQQFIREAIEFYLRQHQQPELPPSDSWAFDLCGIWEDSRPAEQIVHDIISARTPGREISL